MENNIKEIVAAKINGHYITNNLADIVTAAKTNNINQLLNRDIVNLMTSFNLGANWLDLAKSQTLLWIVNGVPTFKNPLGEKKENGK